jgi:putative MATE family efflux protein
MANKYQMDMTKGPLLKKIIVFAIPLMLTGMLQLLYNAADVVVVGKFAGDASLAAVGSTTSLINLIVNTFFGLSLGAGVIVAQAIGSNNKARLTRTVHTSMLLSVICGVIVLIFGFIFSNPLLQLMSSPDDVIGKATIYMKVYFLGMPGFMVYNFGSAILRSAGDTKRPLLILSVSGIANVGLNMLFVITFKMDVAGVALATIISQYITAVWIVIILLKENADYRLFIKKLRIHKNEFWQIINYGMPMGIQSACFSISNVIIQSSINTFGMLVIAGSSAASNIEGFVYQATNSISQTAITFSGQNTGAGEYKRVKTVLFQCYALTMSLGLIIGAVTLLFKTPLLSLYTNNPDVIEAGVIRMNILCLLYGFCGMMDTTSNVSRGMGKSVVPMIITLVFVCMMRVVWIYTIFKTFNTVQCIYWSYPVTWILAIICQLIYFTIVYKGKIKSKN